MGKVLSLVLCVWFLLLPIFGQDEDDFGGGLTDEEFRDLIIELIRQVAEEAVNTPPIIDYETSSKFVIKRYLTLLETMPVTVNFIDVPFAECVEFLRDVTGMNIFFSKDARELMEGVTVRLNVRDLRLKNLLNLLMTYNEELIYGIKYDVLYIGTKEELVTTSLYLEFYFIGDIIFRPPNFRAPDIALPTGTEEP